MTWLNLQIFPVHWYNHTITTQNNSLNMLKSLISQSILWLPLTIVTFRVEQIKRTGRSGKFGFQEDAFQWGSHYSNFHTKMAGLVCKSKTTETTINCYSSRYRMTIYTKFKVDVYSLMKITVIIIKLSGRCMSYAFENEKTVVSSQCICSLIYSKSVKKNGHDR